MIRRYPTHAHALVLVCCAAVFTGCGLRPSLPSASQQAAEISDYLDEGGYATARNYSFDTLHEMWQYEGQALEMTLLAPSAPGVYPLIVYLPGLGESADAGQFWRESWVKAGYTVVSIQSQELGNAFKELTATTLDPDEAERGEDLDLLETESVIRSERDDKARARRSVRTSEMHYLGHQYFAPVALKKRVAQVLWAYAQLKQRAKMGQAVVAKADFAHVLLAGYDIGAQTAAALVGEKFDIELPPVGDFKPLAALILSPAVDLAEGNLKTRYQAINIPLLAVTGGEDSDPYAMSSPQVRSAIWEYSKPGNKYGLSLTYADHGLLAGADLALRKRLRGRLVREPGWFKPQLLEDLPVASRSGPGAGDFRVSDRAKSKRRDIHGYQEIAGIVSVSTAFFDSFAKADGFAQIWLAEKANAWLGHAGSLQIK